MWVSLVFGRGTDVTVTSREIDSEDWLWTPTGDFQGLFRVMPILYDAIVPLYLASSNGTMCLSIRIPTLVQRLVQTENKLASHFLTLLPRPSSSPMASTRLVGIQKSWHLMYCISTQINTFGHMLTFKHFVPLLPGKSTEHDYTNDPANGLIKPNLSVLASMTARVSSLLSLLSPFQLWHKRLYHSVFPL